MKEIYLDNASTTKILESAKQKIIETLEINYANPSSLHKKGFEAQQQIDLVRNMIATEIVAERNEIYFTSGGTESNNLAILGTVKAKQKQGKHVIISAIEHASIFKTCKELENDGYKVTCLKPNSENKITQEEILSNIKKETILVSLMLVNNETGSILPLEGLGEKIKTINTNVIFHIDAVQAFGKIPVKISALNCDLLSISAHKIGGPKGIGALYKSRKANILPIFFGGEQENSLRPGTESTPMIAGFGAAISEAADNMAKNFKYVNYLKEILRNELIKMNGITLNEFAPSSPYIINFSVNGINSETLLHYFSIKNIFISSGSACSKNKKSRVLKNYGIKEDLIKSAVRVSFCPFNTKEEIYEFINALKCAQNDLIYR